MNRFVIAFLVTACFVQLFPSNIAKHLAKPVGLNAASMKIIPVYEHSKKETHPASTSSSSPINNAIHEHQTITRIQTVDQENIIPREKIPTIPSNRCMSISGEKGKIIIDGVVLYEDELFKKKGQVHLDTVDSNVYLNGTLIAKNPGDGSVRLRDRQNISHINIKEFEMVIFHGGFFRYKDALTVEALTFE